MILLWLGLATLLGSALELLPAGLMPAQGALLTLASATCAGLMVMRSQRRRATPAFGMHGQWLIVAALLTLLITRAPLPLHAGSMASMIGIDAVTRQILAHIAHLLLVTGLWQAFSNLSRSRAQAVRELERELHSALTEMVILTAQPPRHAAPEPRARYGVSPAVAAALEGLPPAYAGLLDRLERNPADIAARLALHRRLCEDETQLAALGLHGEDFIAQLEAADRADLALKVAEDCLRQDTTYHLPATQSLALARLAVTLDRPQLCLRLLKHFDVRHPGHPALADAYLLSARALVSLGRTATARALLAAVIKQFPDSPATREAIALSAQVAAEES